MTDRLRRRWQSWLDSTAVHHVHMANGAWWWVCPTCREARREEREQRIRAHLEAMERSMRIERAENPTMLDLAERLDRIEKRLDAGIPRPGRCGAHPSATAMRHLPAACTVLAYSCELDAGHAGMHRDGTFEWGPVTTS